MFTRIALAALLVAVSTSLAAAQSSTAPSGTTQALPAPPMKTAPSSGQTNAPNQTKSQSGNTIINPAAREGEKGLSGNPDEQVQIRRLK
jgi:hypothetical protein